jgi:hypothetical protein
MLQTLFRAQPRLWLPLQASEEGKIRNWKKMKTKARRKRKIKKH